MHACSNYKLGTGSGKNAALALDQRPQEEQTPEANLSVDSTKYCTWRMLLHNIESNINDFSWTDLGLGGNLSRESP